MFEVYRQVFHKVAEQKPLTQAQMLLQSAQLLVEIEQRQLVTGKRTKVLEDKFGALEQEREENAKLPDSE